MSKIYNRNSPSKTAVKKKKNEKNRKRNVIMNFRVTAREKELIDNRIRTSGLSRSEFFIQSCMYQTILVKGNIKTFDRIEKQLGEIAGTISNGRNLEQMESDEIESLRIIFELVDKVYGKEVQNGSKND